MQIPPVRVVFSERDRQEALERIDECLRTGHVAQGKNVREFEEDFANYVGIKNAVAVSSGGAAIEVAMRLLEVKDREVLVPTNTFAATATAVLLAGGRIRFTDTDPKTFGVSLEGLRAAATPETAGVIVVHVGGIISPEIHAIRKWCDEQRYWLFEDAAHAHGSSLEGKMAGRFGCAAAYSFFATKVMTAGEGGMLVTDDDDLADRAQGLRDYGKQDPWVSFHTEIGANWRMSEFCAAVGTVHLSRLDEFIAWREKVARSYTEMLGGVSGLMPILPVGRSSWYKYIVLLPEEVDRERLRRALEKQGVRLSGGVYDIPLHRQPVFESAVDGQFAMADDVCSRHICLPLYYGMTEAEAEYVIGGLKTAITQA